MPGQVIAGTGAVLCLLSPLGFGLSAAGAGLLLLGTVVSAPYARLRGPFVEEWWIPLGLTALLCLAGIALGFLLPVVGRVLLTAGGVGALVLLALSTPPQDVSAEEAT
jgi:hypothetical protein